MSIYDPSTLGESDNQILFNDYTLDPVYRIKARSANKFQIRQQDLPVPFESGSSDFLTLLGDTSYIIEGTMYPASEATYDSGLYALRAVCSLDLNQADLLSTDGYVPYTFTDAADNKQIFMKPLYVELTETTTQGFVQPFTILAKIIDPTIYEASLNTASTEAFNPTVTAGSAIYPFTYTVLYGANTFTVTATATNIGNVPVYPQTMIVVGPVVNPTITNTATGEYITVNVTLNTTSDQLNLTYTSTTQNINLNGNNVANSLATGSTLFKLVPGPNPIQLSGTTVSTGAYAEVQYFSGWALS